MNKAQLTKVRHLLVRYSDSFMDVEDTIEEHRKVIEKHGSVWFGKVGKPLGKNHIDAMNAQCEDGIPTLLFLAQNLGRPGHADYQIFRCGVVQVASELPDRQKRKVPRYYTKKSIDDKASLWVCVESIERIDRDALQDFRIASSKKSLTNALIKSLAGMFVVGEGKPILDY